MFTRIFARAKVAKLILMEVGILVLIGIATASSPLAAANGVMNSIANLQHAPTGTANLQYFPSTHTLVVTTSLIGLAPNSTHPEHIHLGACENPNPGIVKYPLKNLVANEKGQASATTVIQNISGIPAKGWFINVHNGPGLGTVNQYDPIACGDVSNPSGTDSVLTFLGQSPDIDKSYNESATGFTTLRVADDKLTVSITVRGLVPHSAHAAHVHAGDCFYTKGVLYDLSPLVADGSGVATKTVTFSGVSSIPSSGWAINVHYSTNLKTQTGYNVILCGNVVPA